MNNHQLQQQKVINKIEEQLKTNSLNFSTVSAVENYESDPRICLTSVHLPNEEFKLQIQELLTEPLRKIAPDFYYYTADSLHMTIKNIRVINNPPHFTEGDVNQAGKVFSQIIPKHKRFNVYFYRLLLFPNNLVLLETSDRELDSIILDLDATLNKVGIPDDKIYANSKYFFSNITLARFNTPPSKRFKKKVQELSDSIKFKPYTVNSVTLLSCNAVFKNRKVIKTWHLKEYS